MTGLTLAAAATAGVLTILSPCVLPILPVVLGSAASESRFGPAALALGVAGSFTAAGLFLATAGFALGLDEELFHRIAGALLVALGAALLTPALRRRLEALFNPLSTWATQRAGTLGGGGTLGQAGLGAVLGAVWSPCVGPTLGAAALLASQGMHLGQVAVTMLAFGLGAAAPLLLIGAASRAGLARLKGRLSALGRIGRPALAVSLLVIGALSLSGLDKAVESALLAASPQWLTHLTSAI